jgi:hypothetical protein
MGQLREINIKYDMPDVNTAIRRVTHGIYSSKELGAGALKLIHGYGSTGKGGKIRSKTREYLIEQKNKRVVRDIITGENFSIFDEATRAAFLLCDELRRDSDLERHNNGVTFVIL